MGLVFSVVRQVDESSLQRNFLPGLNGQPELFLGHVQLSAVVEVLDCPFRSVGMHDFTVVFPYRMCLPRRQLKTNLTSRCQSFRKFFWCEEFGLRSRGQGNVAPRCFSASFVAAALQSKGNILPNYARPHLHARASSRCSLNLFAHVPNLRDIFEYLCSTNIGHAGFRHPGVKLF